MIKDKRAALLLHDTLNHKVDRGIRVQDIMVTYLIEVANLVNSLLVAAGINFSLNTQDDVDR